MPAAARAELMLIVCAVDAVVYPNIMVFVVGLNAGVFPPTNPPFCPCTVPIQALTVGFNNSCDCVYVALGDGCVPTTCA